MDKDTVNTIEGKVDKMIFVGDSIFCNVLCGNQLVYIKLPLTSDFMNGDPIFLTFSPQYCSVFSNPPRPQI